MKKTKKTKKKPAAAPKGVSAKAKVKESTESKPAKKRKAAAKVSLKDRTTGAIDTVSQFLREVRVELSKVTWPTRKDTLASTSVVLVIVILIAAFLGLVDLGLSKIMRLVLS
jgi:preprotein translocase subunit SecE